MKLLSQTTSLRAEVVVTLGQEAQEEESQVSQGTDEALMINLETVFLNQVEVAQDQAAVVESQILADLENQVTVASRTLAEREDQILADLENQVTVASRTLAEREDLSEAEPEDQILAEPEDLSEADLEDQILAEPEDQAAVAKDVVVIQQTNHIIKK